MEKLKFRLTSESPLLLHNGQLVDPLNKFSKELKKVSSKRGKTDADFEQMAKIEWYGSVYADHGRVCIPSEVLEAAMVNGAKRQKLGKQALAGLFVMDNAILEFDGSKLSIDALWERDQNRFTKAVRVGQSRVMRTRFIVKTWTTVADLVYDPQLINRDQVSELLKTTGDVIGIGDWRPKFGRFTFKALA